MPTQKRRILSAGGAIIIAATCLLSFPTAAQQPGPQAKQGTISDDDFIKLHQQIKELKNPTFRAFLRIQLLSSQAPQPGPTRRQASIELATLGVTDLCAHQDELWTPNTHWLYQGFLKQLKTLQSPEETALKICVLKTETNNSVKDFSSGIQMLRNAETSAAGLSLVKSAILSGQVSPEAMLGQLSSLHAGNSPHLRDLLIDVLSLEEKQPGTLTLRLMPFFSPLFLEKSLPPEITTRYLALAVRATRVSAEELTDIRVRSSVSLLLNGIIGSAKQLSPALYPEIASGLGSLSKNGLNTVETRLAADERIQKASDQLEQLISEATSATDIHLKRHFFVKAARLAKEQGQLRKSVDLATKVESPSWMDDFLLEIVSVAVKKRSPQDAGYAISKMTHPLKKVTAFRLLGEYHGENQEQIKSKEAFTQSDKQLELVANSNEKAKAFLLLAKSVLQYEPVDADTIFRKAVKAINNLPSPEKDQETMYYVQLLPIAEELIRSFKLLANRENETAIGLAAEIKLSELRVSALSGAYSSQE